MAAIVKLKREGEGFLEVIRELYAKRHVLRIDYGKCYGCEICLRACPKEAVSIVEKNGRRVADVDLDKCNFCGACALLCPFGAVSVEVDGEARIPVLESGSFPKLVRLVEVDIERCPEGCRDCVDACPLGLITVEEAGGRPFVKIDIDACPCCRRCVPGCPYDAIRVEKAFYGRIFIDVEKCPEGCRDCVDACPVQAIDFKNSKVSLTEEFCVYCGACRQACPVDAISLEITHIRHTPVKSGAWNKALERIASTKAMAKHLRARAMAKSRTTASKRLSWREIG